MPRKAVAKAAYVQKVAIQKVYEQNVAARAAHRKKVAADEAGVLDRTEVSGPIPPGPVEGSDDEYHSVDDGFDAMVAGGEGEKPEAGVFQV